MNRGDVGLVLGLAGFLLGGVAVYIAGTSKGDVEDLKNERNSDNDNLAGMGSRLQDLAEKHQQLSKRVDGLSTDPKALWDAVHALEVQVKRLESKDPPTERPK